MPQQNAVAIPQGATIGDADSQPTQSTGTQTVPIPDNAVVQNEVPEQSFSQKVGQAYDDYSTGIVKGAGQTANTVSKIINHIPFVGETLAPKVGIDAATQIEAPTNTAQKIGAATEGIGEFFLGDEALKGLSLAERLGLATKVAKLAESNPIIAKIIGHGLNAVRGGTVVTGQQMAHGATPQEAVKTGGEAAALGAGTGALVEGAGAAKNAIKQAYKAVLDTKSIQPVLQQGIRDTLRNVSQENGVPSVNTSSIRDVVKNTADQVYAKSKAQYAELDKATGGQFQRFDNALQNINEKLREVAGIDDDKESALITKKAEVEAAQEKVFDDAKAKGVDPKLVDEAKANYKKAQALYDVDNHLKMSTSGMRPGIGKAEAQSPEAVDPKKLFSRLNKVYDSGRLQQAVGEQNAQDLLEHADNAHLQEQKILNRRTIAKTAGRVTLGTGVGYEAVRGVIGGTH